MFGFKRIFLCGVLFLGLLPVFHPLRAQAGREAALREHVRILTADSLAGRGAGTAGEKKAAAYISRCFKAYGLEFIYPDGVQDFFVLGHHGDTLSSQNIVGIVVGSDPKLKEEYIVIGAHYDHLGLQKISMNGRDSLVVYPGADDNASGVAVMLELAKTMAAQPWLFKRSLVFVAFGAEEIGLVGSWYFVNRAFAPISHTVFMVNIDMIGRSGAGHTFSAYTLAPDTGLPHMLESVDLPPFLRPQILETDYFPSDHRNFFQKQIPTVLFTSGIHSDYHRPGDKSHLLDYTQMESRMAYIHDFLLLVAGLETLPVL
ncbi:MAG: M20/M25/M40 family metallo-hydrolase [Bacteroidales bacterium]|nr:M20/M25/M40 family metallo-hydrolase [Bacteroidales bacterium]